MAQLYGQKCEQVKLTAITIRIRAVGKDKEPLDLSREDHKEAFSQSMQKWRQAMAANEDGSKYGFIDIEGVKLEPFGAPYMEVQA